MGMASELEADVPITVEKGQPPTVPKQTRQPRPGDDLPLRSVYAQLLVSQLLGQIGIFADGRRLGETVANVPFAFPAPVGKVYSPALAFVSTPRVRPIPYRAPAWEVVPDLVIDFVSPD